MGIYADTGALKVTVNDTTGKGRYAADGSARVTLVPGTSFTGLYAADGSMNVVDEEGSLYHPCGAIRGRAALVTYTGLSSPSGALYMSGLVTAAFDPLSLFASSEPGVWYDPSDIERYTATTGPELVTNGTFNTNITGWTDISSAGGSIAWNSAGYMDLVYTTGAPRATQQVNVTSGKWYRFRISNVTSPANLSIQFYIGTTSNGSDLIGLTSVSPYSSATVDFLAISSAAHITVRQTNTGTASVDNISILELTDIGTATMFQDIDGTIPVTNLEQPVALIKDRSRSEPAEGTELVTNGTFDSTVTGWTGVNGTIASVSGELELTGSGGAYPRAQQTISVTINKLYRISITMRRGTTASNVYYNVTGFSDVQSTSTTNQTYTFIARPTNTSLVITLGIFSATGTGTAYFDNISVKEITTTHAYQSTTASQPVLSARVNLLTYTEQFENNVWAKSNTTITTNAIAAPNGVGAADKLEAAINADISGQQVYQNITTIGPGDYIFSVYAKKGSGTADANKFVVRNNTTPTNLAVLSIDYDTGVITQTTGSGATSTDVGNGWWHITIPFTVTTPVGNAFRFYVGSTGGTETVGEFCYAWGADVRLANAGVGIPVYQRVETSTSYDITGFPYYLRFDGVDDFLQTTFITPGTDKVQMFTGVRKLSDAASGIVTEMSTTVNSNAGTFNLFAPSGTAANYTTASRGSAAAVVASYTNAAITAPVTNQVTVLSDISGDNLLLRVNGSDVAQSTTDQGTGNFTAQPLYIGRRAGTSTPFNGYMYNLLVRFGSNLPASTISDTETWVNGKTKAY